MTIEINYIPAIYIGHFEIMTDTYDGSYGDEDYECYEYTYVQMVWEQVL